MDGQTVSPQEKTRFPDGFRILQGKQEYITYTEHSSIRIWPSEKANHYDTHTHSAVEVIMPQSGTSVYTLPEKSFAVQGGELLFVPPDMPHALTEGGDTRRLLFLFEPAPLFALQDMAEVMAMFRQPIYLQEDTDMRRQIAGLLDQTAACYWQKKPMWNAQCYAYLIQCYALLGQNYLQNGAPQSGKTHWRIDPEIMNSAMAYINEHYMGDISLEDAADFVGFSKYYFSRTFKEFFGRSFSEMLLYVRVNEAANLLMQTNKSIHAIAELAGFGSIATFNRVFRNYKNCTPTQFRSIYGTMGSTDKALAMTKKEGSTP